MTVAHSTKCAASQPNGLEASCAMNSGVLLVDLCRLVVHRGPDASLGWVRRLAPLALLILALCPAAASAQALPKNFFGMMVNGPLDSPKADLMAEDGVMHAAGVESQRVPFNWDLIQRDPNARARLEARPTARCSRPPRTG